MERILVAGGAGFIGSHICKTLLEKGKSVVCIDNLITGNKSNIAELLNDKNFSFYNIDITQAQAIPEAALESVTAIFHLASPASPNEKSPTSYINHPIETLLVNSVGTYNLLELAKTNNALFLFASTSEVYGDPEISPQTEAYWGHVNPNGVRSVYDEGKRFGEAITMAYVRKYDLNARIIRIFNTYGPQMQVDDGRVVSNFINQAIKNESITIYGSGEQTRSFCYVDDMIEGIQKAMFTEGTKGEVINLGNPDERTVLDLAKVIKDMTQSQSELVFEPLPLNDPKVRRPDISKAKKLIGWEPKISLQEGLAKTIAYFQSL